MTSLRYENKKDNKNSILCKNIFQKKKKKIKTFSDGSIYSQQPGAVGNVKGSSSGRRVIQEGNLDLHKEIKIAMNTMYVGNI